jgi:DHA1 family multidrug resistance protein-like MFS transporter
MEKNGVSSWKQTLYIIFFAQLVTSIGFSCFFPFLPFYVAELGTKTQLSTEFLSGLVFSAQAFTMMFASPLWGTIADRFGRKLMVQRAMFGGAVIICLMGFVRTAEELVILRACQGMVTGVIGAHNALVASVVPRERTGYAMGLLQVGLGAGIAIGPVIGGLLADLLGYRAAFYVTSLMLFISGVVVSLGIKEDFQPAAGDKKSRKSLLAKWKSILAAQGVMITYGMRAISQFGRMMVYPILPLFIQSLLSDPARLNTFTGAVTGVHSISITLSALYLGRLGDRIGHQRILIFCLVASAVFYFPQSLIQTAWQLLVLQALAGMALGGIIPTIGALLAQYTQQGDEGTVYGLDNSVHSGARALAPMIGAGVAIWFGLRATFVVLGLLFLVGGILCLLRLPRK